MSEWLSRPLGELTLNFDDRRIPIKEGEREQGSIPYYGASGIIDYIKNYVFDGEYLLIAEDGENLRTRKTPIAFLAKGKFWVNNHAHVVQGNEYADTRFLMYAIQSTDISGYLSGSTIPKLTQGSLNQILIHAPISVDEQKNIAEILGSIDDKIELNRQINETLEAMVRAIFKSWFIDFDPVRNKAAGKQPSGIDAETAALFPFELLEDADNREVPVGWSVCSLSEIIEIIGGGTPKTTREEYWNGTIPWFSVVDAPQESDVFVINTERTITEAGLENSSTNILEIGTSIISARGTVGRVALVGTPMTMNQSCYGIKGIGGYPNYFIYYLLRYAVDDLKRKTHGTVFETITRQTFDNVFINKPPVKIAQQFDNLVMVYHEKILNNLYESSSLERIRDLLLPKLISGDLRIQNNFGGNE